MKTMKLITILLMTSSLSTFSFGGKKHKGKFKEMIKTLNLSSEQVDKLKEYRKSNKDKKKNLRESIKQARLQVKEGFKNNASDYDLKSNHKKVKQLTSEMAELRFEKMLFLRKILTQEQREKFIELRQNKRKNRL